MRYFWRIKEKHRVYYNEAFMAPNGVWLIPYRGKTAFRNDGYIIAPDEKGFGVILFHENGEKARWTN